MLVLHQLCTLDSIYAASGLVKIDNTFYVIADDALSLGIIEENRKTQLIPLFPGALPRKHEERKKVKPDWEALALISKHEFSTELLAVPSGSKPNRQLGAYIVLNDEGLVSMQIDFTPVYSELTKNFPNLNIEGACLTDKYFQLFQRGNGADAINAVIDLDLEGVLNDIRHTQVIKENRITGMQEYSLGKAVDISFGFTDACFVNRDETWFLAVAEGGSSTYEDGSFAGSVLGLMDATGLITATYPLSLAIKPEGLHVDIGDNNERFIYVVTDADSSEIPSALYRGVIHS